MQVPVKAHKGPKQLYGVAIALVVVVIAEAAAAV